MEIKTKFVNLKVFPPKHYDINNYCSSDDNTYVNNIKSEEEFSDINHKDNINYNIHNKKNDKKLFTNNNINKYKKNL